MELFDDLEDFGSFDDAVAGDVRNPYPDFARTRAEEPVQKLDLSAMMPGAEGKPLYFVHRMEDITTVLRDDETYSSKIVIDFFGPVLGNSVMLGQDEPEHRRQRALVQKAFLAKNIAKRQDDLIQGSADFLVDRIIAREPAGKAELVKDFTANFPTRIIAGLLGLPKEDFARFQRWSISIIGFLSNMERGIQASQEVQEYFATILEARRQDPRQDLISDLAAAEIDGEKLPDDQIFSFLRLLLPAGVETTYRSTGNLLFGLLSNPDQLEALREDRSLVPDAIDEAVRWEPPLINITRVATRDTVLGGVEIEEGSSVMPMLGSANHADESNPDPDTFDIFRKDRQLISFGTGVHNCLGIHLAKAEMSVAINTLLDRLPDLRLDPDGDDPHIRGGVFRSPTSLPVLFTPQP